MLRERLMKTNVSIFDNIIISIRQKLKNSETSKILLFGAGAGGVTTLNFLKKFGLDVLVSCFIDNNPLKHNTVLNDVPVKSCDEGLRNYVDELILISCGEGDEIIHQLGIYNVPKSRIFIPDISVIDESDSEFISNHVVQLNELYELFADDKSRDVLVGILNYKLTHDIKFITEVADIASNQYFDEEIITFYKDDIFLDCGAYIGDTAKEYEKHSGGKYQKIICLEVDPDNYAIIEEKRSNFMNDIELVNVACWSEQAELIFDKIGSGSGTILNDVEKSKANTILVKADKIDNICERLGCDRISFLKMDIEGAEYDALLGARQIIERDKPTLMISVYHKQDDLLRIPMLIKSINYEYRFYLRHYRTMSVQETVLYAV